MSRTKKQLLAEALAIGISPESLVKPKRTSGEIRDLLAEHYARTDGRTRPPLQQLPCMLARNVADLPEGEFAAIVQSRDWTFEEKFDGCRVKLHFGKTGNRLDTRRRSDRTHEYSERTDQFPHFRDAVVPKLEGTVIDGEMVMPRGAAKEEMNSWSNIMAVIGSAPERAAEIQQQYGKARLMAFDLLYLNGDDCRDVAFADRQLLLLNVWSAVFKTKRLPELRIFLSYPCDRWDVQVVFARVIRTGGEGVMLKHREAKYPRKEGIRSKGLYKWKRVQTIDAWISGYTPGKGKYAGQIGAFELSVYDHENKAHVIGACQPGSDDYRLQISHTTADGLRMDSKLPGKVVEIEFQERTKNKKARHCRLVRFRPDKNPADCTLDWWAK